MVSLETVEGNSSRSIIMEDSSSSSSPRISFSADSIGSTNLLITIKSPQHHHHHINDPDFEFLSSTQQSTLDTNMLSADELFAEGKLLPFWQVQKLNAITLNHAGACQEEEDLDEEGDLDEEEERIRPLADEAPAAAAANGGGGGFSSNGWFMEEDPSPRPPNCTVLFKELLRLKKQRRPAATLSPSSSTSSSSSSLGSDVAAGGGGDQIKNSNVKRVKKGSSSLERTRSATIRIRPMVNVPICTAVKTSNVLPPLFPTRKGRLGR